MPDSRRRPLEFRADLVRRLRCAEGHLHAITGMIESGVDCQKALDQMIAVQAALREVHRRLAQHHLDDCLLAALRSPNPATQERMRTEIVALYQSLGGRQRLPGR